MKKIIAKIKRNYALLRAFFPTKLPQGMSEFNDFAASIIDLYNFPKDNDGFINMIATMIQHFDRDVCSVPKYKFARLMRKAVSNEVAFYVIQDLKLKKKKEDEAKEEAAKLQDAGVS